MSEWWTYELSDLVLFSSHTYYRLIELYNAAIWPLQLVTIIAGSTIIYLVWRQPRAYERIIAFILVSSWLWVAWAFHWQRFSGIHWIASYYALAFVVEALILLLAGIIKNSLLIKPATTVHQYTGFSMIIFGVLLQPILTLLDDRNWKQIDLFGITPEPTVFATIGLLLMTDCKKFWWLFTVPVLWCIFSAATFWVLGSVNAFVMCIAVLIAVFFIVWPVKRGSQLSKN